MSDGDGVGAVAGVPAVLVGRVVAVDIDRVGDAIPRQRRRPTDADGHAVADILADAVRLGINAKV